MEKFEVQVGAKQRKLTVEQVSEDCEQSSKCYKLFDNDPNGDWLDGQDTENETDVPVSSYLGTMVVKADKNFTFDGPGHLSGNDLLAIAAQITRHPSFEAQ